jgi:Fe-S cluster assembly iron-binding protein IscA
MSKTVAGAPGCARLSMLFSRGAATRDEASVSARRRLTVFMQSSSLAPLGLECRRPDEKRGAIAKVAARQIAELWAEDEKIVRIAVDKPRFC